MYGMRPQPVPGQSNQIVYQRPSELAQVQAPSNTNRNESQGYIPPALQNYLRTVNMAESQILAQGMNKGIHNLSCTLLITNLFIMHINSYRKAKYSGI
jgi:hypothetical protein